jgi:hypothetical protein
MTRKRQKTTSLLSSLPQELRDMFTSKEKVSSDQVQVEEAQESERPNKRQRRNGLLPQKLEQYDATGLAPFYTDVSQVPSHLKKCQYASSFQVFNSSDIHTGLKTFIRDIECSLDILKAAFLMKRAGIV